MKATFAEKWQKAKRTKKKRILLALWSAIIHKRDKVCQYCQRTGVLNAHHIFTKSKDCTAFSLANGILLCSGHHTLSSDFSAHKTPRAFFSWLEKQKSKEWVDILERQSNGVCKWDYELVLTDLLRLCNDYEIDVETIKF